MYLKKMSEQVIRLVEGGNPNKDSTIDRREVQLLLVQEINKFLKAEHFNVHIPLNDRVPPHTLIAGYDITPVSTGYGTQAFTKTRLSEPFPGTYWTHPSGDYWTDDDGNYFVVDGSAATLTITANGGTSYTITISSATEPSGLEWSDVVSFITFSSTEEGYFYFYGIANAGDNSDFPVSKFDWAGVSNLAATADGFTFDYDVVVSGDEAIRDAVAVSNNAISGNTGANSIELVTLEKFVLTTDTTSEAKATATLPAQPINLPRGMGVWRVYSKSDPYNPFIPLSSGENFVYGGMLDDSLELLRTYEYFDNKTLVFNRTAAQLPTDMRVQLLIVDPEVLGETDLLPVPADAEADIILAVANKLMKRQPEDNLANMNPNIR